ACLLIALILTGNIINVEAQDERQTTEQSETAAKRMAELSTSIAESVTAALSEIDFSELARESEKLARLSASEAHKAARLAQRERAAIDWSELQREVAKAQAEIAEMNLAGLAEQWTSIETAPYQEEKIIEKVYNAGRKDRLRI